MRSKYKTNEDRLIPTQNVKLWDRAECYLIQDALAKKGYLCVLVNGYRLDQNGVERNNIILSRHPQEVSNVLELLFRLRIDVEVHVESSYEVGILLLDNVSVYRLVSAVKRMPKKGGRYY